ncbi:asparaginase [beta proteobacterium AAP121]|nr:asparaginase [beta proteobacterium AAP65]KPF94989.1 asparaginase [beta proteobacterium AAP121]
MPSTAGVIVILGTGGTIAGTAASATQHTGYTAGALGAEALVAAVPALQGRPLEAESIAQIDSSNMDGATWARLAVRCAEHLARPEVAGVVVTHGTDTLEETAYLLHRLLAPTKPLVLTAAMRPATALSPDGPQNLFDAVNVAGAPGVHGVLAVLGGVVFGAADLRKVHGYRVEAFSAGDAGPVALLEDGQLRVLRPWAEAKPHAAAAGWADVLAGQPWPLVDIVTSHALADGRVIDALVAAGSRGLVVAGTGNGSVHAAVKAAAQRAMAQGVRVLRASRCPLGGVVGGAPDELPSAGLLTPVQARIELMLDLLVLAD